MDKYDRKRSCCNTLSQRLASAYIHYLRTLVCVCYLFIFLLHHGGVISYVRVTCAYLMLLIDACQNIAFVVPLFDKNTSLDLRATPIRKTYTFKTKSASCASITYALLRNIPNCCESYVIKSKLDLRIFARQFGTN